MNTMTMYTTYSILNTILNACRTLIQLALPEPDFERETIDDFECQKRLDLNTSLLLPKPDSRDTYNLAAIIQYQQLCFRPITLQPGQVISITKELEYHALEDESESGTVEEQRGRRGRPTTLSSRPALRSVARAVVAEYSREWFTLDDCGINAAGQLEWRFIVNRAKRTPKGRVVIVDVMVEGDDLPDYMDDLRWSNSTKYFYQIG